jgi:carbonic anhydrase/acetyltransferase-like protein (isoleucine patch superfamily)
MTVANNYITEAHNKKPKPADRELVLVGCRGNFVNILQVTYALGIKIHGILDKYYPVGHQVDGISVIGSEDILLDTSAEAEEFKQKYDFFPGSFWAGEQNLQNRGLDNGQVRLDRINLLDQSGVNVINLISPSVLYFPTFNPGYKLTVGKGVYIGEHVGIAHHVNIGDYCYIDNLSAVHSDVNLGRNVLIGIRSTLAHADIGNNVRVGLNCTVAGGLGNNRVGLTVGSGSTIWNGSNVMKDVPEDSMYVPPMGKVISKQKTIQDEA